MTPRGRQHDGFASGDSGFGGRSSGTGGAGGAGGAGGGGAGGGAWRLISRIFENPDNPLGWSLKIFTAWGIAVRIHLFTILFVVFMLLWSIPASNAGLTFMSISMASLLLLVLLHEFGHCFACRAVGGEADRIVMLPIGGLALIRPPNTWRGNLITTAGGPLVNVAIAPLTTALLLTAGLGDHIIFNPLDPIGVVRDPAFSATSNAAALAKVALWWLHYTNLVLLAFNVLIPAYPLDGGRILQALLWRKLGYHRAMEISVTIGIAAAMALGVFGLVADESLLVAIAFFAGWSCWVERKRLRSEWELASADHSLSGPAVPEMEHPEDDREEARRASEAAEQAELDRILEKISTMGMASLSRGERKSLERATKKRRQE